MLEIRRKTCKNILIRCGRVLFFTICNSVLNMLVMGLILGQGHIYHCYPVIMQKYPPLKCIVRFVVVYM